MMCFLKNVFVTLKDLFPLTLAGVQYPFLFSLGFYNIIPSHAELQKSCAGENSTMKHSLLQITAAQEDFRCQPAPYPSPRTSLKQHSI